MSHFSEQAREIALRQYQAERDIPDIFYRVAKELAPNFGEVVYGDSFEEDVREQLYFQMLNKKFIPGGRILAGAGTKHGNLINCFVQGPVESWEKGLDNFSKIAETAFYLAITTKVGGGNGLNLDWFDDFNPGTITAIQESLRYKELVIRVDESHPDYHEVLSIDTQLRSRPINFVHEIKTTISSKLPREGAVVIKIPDDMGGIISSLFDVASAILSNDVKTVVADFSDVRPAGSYVKGSSGHSSGPASFIKILLLNLVSWLESGGPYASPVAHLRYVFAPILDVVKLGGTRRGAGMATMYANNPLIIDFITAKHPEREKREGAISSFNLSVLAPNSLFDPASTFQLKFPANEEKFFSSLGGDGDETRDLLWFGTLLSSPNEIGPVSGETLLGLIANYAWKSGEPGLLYVDTINDKWFFGWNNDLKIEATNPCGEIPLLPGESCDLGAINLGQFVTNGELDEEALRETAKLGVKTLDAVLDTTNYPLDYIKERSLWTRRIGLGVMGLADYLIKRGIRYGSDESLQEIKKVVGIIAEEAFKTSRELGKKYGYAPIYEDDFIPVLDEIAKHISKTTDEDVTEYLKPRRNLVLLTVAPTGTTSMVADASSGIEPVFAAIYYRRVGGEDGEIMTFVHPLFKELLSAYPPSNDYAIDGSWDWDKVAKAVQANHGSVRGLDFVPAELQEVFVTAHDVAPHEHVAVQAAVQKEFDRLFIGNSISKTINLPNDATVEDVLGVYQRGFLSGLKGVTVYRDGSRDFQVLNVTTETDSTETTSDTPTERSSTETINTSTEAPMYTRPQRLNGFTDQVRLSDQFGRQNNYLVTVNFHESGAPIEVILSAGKAGDEVNADSEAIGRLISLALQYGVPLDAIVHTLDGISGGLYGSYGKKLVSSKAGLIAAVLSNLSDVPKQEIVADAVTDETLADKSVDKSTQTCPVCNGPLKIEEGCMTCQVCGWSKCG